MITNLPLPFSWFRYTFDTNACLIEIGNRFYVVLYSSLWVLKLDEALLSYLGH